MSDEAQLIVGVILTGLALMVVLAGWLTVRRKLRIERTTPVTVVTKFTTRAAWWRRPESDFAWNQVNDYWLSVLRGRVDEQAAVDRGQDASSGSGLTHVRVPGRVFRRSRPGTWLDLVSHGSDLVHPYYRVRWLIWGCGGIAAVLMVNGVSLFFVEEALLPSWLQWIGAG